MKKSSSTKAVEHSTLTGGDSGTKGTGSAGRAANKGKGPSSKKKGLTGGDAGTKGTGSAGRAAKKPKAAKTAKGKKKAKAVKGRR